MNIKDVRIVCLKRTKLSDKSDREHGKLEFDGAVHYVASKDYLDASTRPEDKLKWVSKELRGGHTINRFRFGERYDFVTTADPYYPEGALLDDQGHWVFDDMVLMKKPYVEYLKSMADSKKKESRQIAGMRKGFEAKLGDAKIDETMQREILGSETELL